MGRKILGVRPGHAYGRHLCQIVEHRQAVMVRIVLRRAIGHLDQEAAGLRDHKWKRIVGGDQMRVDGEPQQSQPILQIVLPDRLVPLEQVLAAPDVIDQDVEPSAFRPNSGDQRLDLARDQMIDANRNPFAAEFGDQRRGFLDRLGAAISDGRPLALRPVT